MTLPLQLRLTEIFLSLQGESLNVGLPTVFIRLTGCPLRCQYCDSAYAFKGGKWFSMETIMQTVQKYGVKHICVTGGEPLAQQACIPLLKALCDQGYSVSLETSGALSIAEVDPRVIIVMDIKTPASLESAKNDFNNLQYLKKEDQLKFVLCDREDYEWACALLKEYALHEKASVLFSPSWNQLEAATLADWIIVDALPVRFQMQLHKILWGDVPGR